MNRGPGRPASRRNSASARSRASADPICAIARSLDVIGERWSLLIIRDAFYGRATFNEFRASLGISTDVLTARLNTLVDEGILERRPYRPEAGGRGSRERHAYHLTPDGRQLRPVLGALLDWGNKHRPNDYGPPRCWSTRAPTGPCASPS
ncbi:winged helix-turn-helix transcriptional regulator [Streptomyces sp. NPDC001902]